MVAQAVESIGTILKDFGGWGAFLLVVIVGGRAFMSLARDFSNKVVDRLDDICAAINGQERRVDVLSEKVDTMKDEVHEQGQRIERLAESVAAKGKVS